MKTYYRSLVAITALVLAPVAMAEETYPPMQFFSTVSKDKLLAKIRELPQFAEIDDDALGSPIILSVRHFTRMTAGGSAAGVTSAVLSGSTLGLIPIVTNEDLVIRYEVLVHGVPTASFEYVENFTDVDSLYNVDSQDLEPEALAWAESTVDQFLEEILLDPGLDSLYEEYQYYFGDE